MFRLQEKREREKKKELWSENLFHQIHTLFEIIMNVCILQNRFTLHFVGIMIQHICRSFNTIVLN